MAPYINLQIVIAVYNDWESVEQLFPVVGEQFQKGRFYADLLLVDDGSSHPLATTWRSIGENIGTIRILRLSRNLDHQRAICIELSHLRQESSCSQVLVMDGDGEDDPADIPRLVGALEESGSSSHNARGGFKG